MRKDIEIPIVENVHLAAVKEWDEEMTGQQWNVYLINNRKEAIEAVLAVSRGNSEDRKTSTLRHGLGDIEAEAAKKIEFIATEVLGFTNEYLVTFFAENKLFERSFVFEPLSISETNHVTLPVLEAEGVLAR